MAVVGHGGVAAGWEGAGGDIALAGERRRDGHAGLDVEASRHVDDPVAQERRAGGAGTAGREPAHQLTDAVGDPADRVHRDDVTDPDVRLLGARDETGFSHARADDKKVTNSSPDPRPIHCDHVRFAAHQRWREHPTGNGVVVIGPKSSAHAR
jgi:hypothetical protein